MYICTLIHTHIYTGASWRPVVQVSLTMHQEITLVCICRLKMCLHVTMTLNDIYMSNNFDLISLRRLIFNPT